MEETQTEYNCPSPSFLFAEKACLKFQQVQKLATQHQSSDGKNRQLIRDSPPAPSPTPPPPHTHVSWPKRTSENSTNHLSSWWKTNILRYQSGPSQNRYFNPSSRGAIVTETGSATSGCPWEGWAVGKLGGASNVHNSMLKSLSGQERICL